VIKSLYFNISIIIPIRNHSIPLSRVLSSINNQSLAPHEVVIVDSSTDNAVCELISNFDGVFPILYHCEQNTYPGKARNIGVGLAKSDWIAFLDSKTIPDVDWLERYQHLVMSYHADVVFGVTQFYAETPFQKTLRAATYGAIGHHTVPGTLIKKKVFTDSSGFLEYVRMGEDIEWRERLIKNNLNIHKPDEPLVTYHGLPDNFSSTVKKYLTSAYHTARLSILRNVKDAYLTLLLIFSAIILPKWNYLISGWDTNPFFIPHVTKIYLMALMCLFLIYQLIHYLFFRNISSTLFSRVLKLMLIVFITLAVYKWNAVIAEWIEDAVLYVPHITKMYVGGILLASIFYRGLFLPFKRKVKPSYLFPFRWIKVGLLGLSLDLVKAPWYVVGAFMGMYKK
jgi:glycosyltransferase involved in cell wall biosynthesis|tara:strand:- start:292 stop:1479 length:1188 start_codon:yes stop_codon:yes gene_type:complete